MRGTNSKDARIRLHRLYVRRLRRSRLRAVFHERVARDAASGFPGGWVVDVGCGPGLLETRLHGLLQGAKIVGLDMDPKMVGIARADAGVWGVLGNVSSLPFKDASVALFVSTASLKDWARPADGLREVARALRPDGRALIFDFLTAGSGSRPRGSVRRFGIVSWLLGALASRVWPFTLEDARGIGSSLESVADAKVDVWADLGVVRIEIRRRAN